jgi:hypothetical protein
MYIIVRAARGGWNDWLLELSVRNKNYSILWHFSLLTAIMNHYENNSFESQIM